MTKTINLTFALILIIVVIILGAGLYVFRTINAEREGGVRIDSVTLQSRIEQIAELATLNYIYQGVGVFERYETGNFFGSEWRWPFTTRTFIIRYEGEVRFGVDVDRVAIDVDNSANRITVSLPVARVLTHVVHEDSVEVLDESTGLFSRASITDYQEFMVYEKQRREEWLIYNGLLSQARANAESTIRGIIEAIIEQMDVEYEIIFI